MHLGIVSADVDRHTAEGLSIAGTTKHGDGAASVEYARHR